MVGWKKMAISRFIIVTPKLTCDSVCVYTCVYIRKLKKTAAVLFSTRKPCLSLKRQACI